MALVMIACVDHVKHFQKCTVLLTIVFRQKDITADLG